MTAIGFIFFAVGLVVAWAAPGPSRAQLLTKQWELRDYPALTVGSAMTLVGGFAMFVGAVMKLWEWMP